MKIYICHIDLFEHTDKHFQDLTDEEVIQLCKDDESMELHDEFDSIEEMSAHWNSDEMFAPLDSYMRVIND